MDLGSACAKLASSSNEEANYWLFRSSDDMSDVTDLSACTAEKASWSRSYIYRLSRQPMRS